MSAIHDAVKNGDVEKVKKLLDVSPMLAEEEDQTEPMRLKPIHLAAVQGEVAVVDLLLKFNVDVNSRSSLGTPLHMAATTGKVRMVEFLLNHGADINAKDLDQRTPLNNAQEGHKTEVVNLLRSRGAEENKPKGCLGMLAVVIVSFVFLLSIAMSSLIQLHH